MNSPENRPISDRVEPHKRGDVLTKIEVDCRSTAYPAPGGHLLNFGKQTLTVLAKDVQFFRALVEQEPEELEGARKRFQKKLDRFVADGLDGIDEPTARQLRTEQLISSYPNSVEATFFADTGRDLKPLISVTVLEDGIVPAVNDAEVTQAAVLAGIVAREVAKALQSLGAANTTQTQAQAGQQQTKK